MKQKARYNLKRLVVKYYTRIVISLGVLFLAFTLIVGELTIGKSIPVDSKQIEQRIDNCLSQGESLSGEWVNALNDSLFITQLWKSDIPFEWRREGVSLMLYKSDSLLLWSNYAYSAEYPPSNFTSQIGIFESENGISLYKKKERADKVGIVTIKLQNGLGEINREVFGTDRLTIQLLGGIKADGGTIPIKALFSVIPGKIERIPNAISVIGWIGLLLLLIGIKRFFRKQTHINNAFKVSTIFFIVIIGLTAFLVLTDLFIPKFIFTKTIGFSVGNLRIIDMDMFIISLCIAIYAIYLYRARKKIAINFRKMSAIKRQILFLLVLLAINSIILIFHYTLVNLIYHTSINADLYKFTLIDANTILLYVICAMFIVYRLLFNAASRALLVNDNPIRVILFSVLLFGLMMIPLAGKIENTGWILFLFHTFFVMITYLGRDRKQAYTFIPVITLFAIYIMVLTNVESNITTEQSTKVYAQKLIDNESFTEAEVERYRKYTYIKISQNDILTKENNNFNMAQLMSIFDGNIDTTVNLGGYRHLLYHDKSDLTYEKKVIVSTPLMSPLDYAAFFAYIYIVLYIISIALLKLAGYEYSVIEWRGRLALRIRLVVVGVVLFAMALVFIVTTLNTFNSYDNNQRRLMLNNMRALHNSFKGFDISDKSEDEALIQWFALGGTLISNDLTVFSAKGDLLATRSHLPSSFKKMNSYAYVTIYWHRAPFYYQKFEVKKSKYNSIYIPLHNSGKRIGYLSMNQLESVNTSTNPRYDALIYILNILVVVVFVAIILSMLLYGVLTRQLGKLQRGMEGIAKLSKIEDAGRGTDEISLLIRQYNNMVDYIREAYDILIQSERESAWRTMAQQVAHEIKNPLTPMRLKIQMLQRARQRCDAELDQKTDETLVLLLEQIDLLTQIASEFSEFAKISVGKFQFIEVSSLLSRIGRLYADDKIFYLHPLCEKMFIRVDPYQIQRVLINLCQNAVQAVEERGGDNGEISLRAEREEDMVVFIIVDNGVGIDKSLRDKIFQPNFTTKVGGTGLGLVISRQIVLNAGGSISYQSEKNVGTTFVFKLPYYASDTEEVDGQVITEQMQGE